jgi:splicing factor U2AF subunit
MNAPLIGRKVQFPTRVLCFKNILVPSELDDDDEFKDICDDIREECNKFGRVMSINIPRTEADKEVVGVGHAFVEFYTLEESKESRRVCI